MGPWEYRCEIPNCTPTLRRLEPEMIASSFSKRRIHARWVAKLVNEVRKIKGDDKWVPSYTSKICSRHFKKEDFVCGGRHRRLKPGSLPTLNLPDSPPEECPIAEPNQSNHFKAVLQVDAKMLIDDYTNQIFKKLYGANNLHLEISAKGTVNTPTGKKIISFETQTLVADARHDYADNAAVFGRLSGELDVNYIPDDENPNSDDAILGL